MQSPWESIHRLNEVIYKMPGRHDEVAFIPSVQGWFDVHYIIDHVNRRREKTVRSR